MLARNLRAGDRCWAVAWIQQEKRLALVFSFAIKLFEETLSDPALSVRQKGAGERHLLAFG